MFILIVLFSALFSTQAIANTEPADTRVSYAEGDRLFIWASYLNLREEPHQDAKVISMIPRGALVKIANDQVDAKEFSLTLIPDFTPADDPYTTRKGEKLKGRWVEVEYSGIKGYVFDGYLSKIIPIKKGKTKNPGELFKKYLLQNYRGALITEAPLMVEFNEKVITPDNQLTYTQYYDFDCEVFELNMEEVKLQEALMIMTKLFNVDGVDHREDGKYYLINKDDPYSRLIVEQTATGAKISVWWCEGC